MIQLHELMGCSPVPLRDRVVVVGAGSLAAGLALCQHGVNCIVSERDATAESRLQGFHYDFNVSQPLERCLKGVLYACIFMSFLSCYTSDSRNSVIDDLISCLIYYACFLVRILCNRVTRIVLHSLTAVEPHQQSATIPAHTISQLA